MTDAEIPPTEPPDAALLAVMPLGIGTVLVAGSAAPAIARAFAARDPAARVQVLAPGEEPSMGAGSFGCIVLAGVLAGHADPAALLATMAKLLAPGGVLVADAANAEYWRTTAALLRGGWRQDAGARNSFSLGGMRAALEAGGLVPVEALPREPEADAAQAFVMQMTPALEAMGIDPKGYLRRAAPRRLQWRATRGRPKRLLVVAQTLKPVGGVNDVRIHMPLAALATRPGVTVIADQNPAIPAPRPDEARILILQRRLLDSPAAPAYVQSLRARGFLVVQEFDDDPAHWPSIAASDDFAFRGVHAVQTSTTPLEALFQGWNPDVAVFANTVDHIPPATNFRDPRRLRLFLGALRREDDTAPFIEALNRVLAAAGDRLFVEVIFDRAGFEALRTPHKRFHPLMPYAEYRALMAGCEIAFLPLADNRFNRFKSDLKFVEAASHRLCCVASPVVYGGTIRHGETGLIAASPAAVEASLRNLLAAPDKALAMAEAARRWVMAERMMAGQVEARLAWYHGLWERRAALDAALLQRCPAIAG